MHELSTEHLQNIRTLLDGMAMDYAQLTGRLEALKLLYPRFMNSQENNQIYTSVRSAIGPNGIPLPIYFTEISRNIGLELKKRGIEQ